MESVVMETSQILLLALVQGITEFLPISSSGHLLLTPLLFGYELQSIAFDVSLHLGTLAAVMIYFRRRIKRMIQALIESIKTHSLDDPDARLGVLIIFATLPVILLGVPLKWILEILRADASQVPFLIAITTIGFGLLLGWADWRGSHTRNEYSLTWKEALFIGLLQTIAIIPGTSRSGITITAGLLLGLTRQATARFSFLLAIPTIIMAGGMETLELLKSSEPIDWTTPLLGMQFSFLIGYLTVRLFLQFIGQISMLPFVIYRLLLGGTILLLFFFG